jgi:hypothetical protein
MSDVVPSTLSNIAFTNAAISSWGVPLGLLVGHYVDGTMIRDAGDLLPFVGQSVQVVNAAGDTVVGINEMGLNLLDPATSNAVLVTVSNGMLSVGGSTLGTVIDTDEQDVGLSGTMLTITDGAGVELGSTFATDAEVLAVSNVLASVVQEVQSQLPTTINNVQFYYDFSESLEVNNQRNGGTLGGIENLILQTNAMLGAVYQYVAAENDRLTRAISTTDTFTFYWRGLFQDAGSEHTIFDNRTGRQIRLYKDRFDHLRVFLNNPTTFLFDIPVVMDTPYFISLRVRPNGVNTDYALTINGVEYTDFNATAFDSLSGDLNFNELQTGAWPGDGLIAEVGLVDEWIELDSIDRIARFYAAELDPYDPLSDFNTDNQNLALSGTELTITGGASVGLGTTFATDAELDGVDSKVNSVSNTLSAAISTVESDLTTISNNLATAGGGDIHSDGSVAMAADLNMGGNCVTNTPCIWLTDPTTGDSVLLEFTAGQFTVGGTNLAMATAKMQQAVLRLGTFDFIEAGSTNVLDLISGGSGTGAYEYSVLSNAMLTGTTLSWTNNYPAFAIEARRIGDADYYTSPWYSQIYRVGLGPLNIPLATASTQVFAPTPTSQASFGFSIDGNRDSFAVGSSGIAEVDVYKKSGGSWSSIQTITPPVGATNVITFGREVGINEKWMVVGDPLAATVYLYELVGSSWVFNQQITKTVGGLFGHRAKLSDDTLVVLADREGDGVAYIYEYDGTTWNQQFSYANPKGATTTEYFNDVAIDGDLVVVGAYRNDIGSQQDAGEAYVFRRTGTSWALEATLQDPSPTASQQVGRTVEVDEETGTIILGDVVSTGISSTLQPYLLSFAYNNATGSWDFEQRFSGSNMTVNSGQFGNELYLRNGNQLIASDVYRDDFYIFERNASGTWIELQKIQSSHQNDDFVAVGDTLIATDRSSDVHETNAGSVHIYE